MKGALPHSLRATLSLFSCTFLSVGSRRPAGMPQLSSPRQDAHVTAGGRAIADPTMPRELFRVRISAGWIATRGRGGGRGGVGAGCNSALAPASSARQEDRGAGGNGVAHQLMAHTGTEPVSWHTRETRPRARARAAVPEFRARKLARNGSLVCSLAREIIARPLPPVGSTPSLLSLLLPDYSDN